MPRPSNSFTSLGGVPVHYDRLSGQSYGTRGIAHTFYCTQQFETKLDECFNHLWAICPYGRAEVITSAGAYVDKPGFHGLGRALDLDGIFWSNKTFVTLYDGFQGRNRKLYLAVEAVIRMHFGQVLNYSYNAPHRDHFHIDDLEPGFNQGSKSGVYFLQNALSYVLGFNIGRDGRYGNETDGAVRDALSSFGLAGSLQDRQVWLAFLDRTAREAFEAAEPVEDLAAADLILDGLSALSERRARPRAAAADHSLVEAISPNYLLRNLYKVLRDELGDMASRKTVEGAAIAFVSHPEIQKILDRHE